MWAVSSIGRGTTLAGVRNGVLALSVSALTNVAILTQALFRNLQAVCKALSGLRTGTSGRMVALLHRQVKSSFSIGRVTAKLTMRVLWSESKTVQFTSWRETPAMLADSEAILSAVVLFTVTVYPHIKRRNSSAWNCSLHIVSLAIKYLASKKCCP